MKKTLSVTIVLAVIAGGALAASTASEAEKSASPHGSMTTKEGGMASAHGSMTTKSGTASPHGTLPAGEPGKPSAHPAAIPSDTNLVNRGEVLEVIDSPMYTYARVTTPRGPTWLAAYKMEVAKGAMVRYSNGMAMTNFHSKAIDRTFDSIIFVDALEVTK